MAQRKGRCFPLAYFSFSLFNYSLLSGLSCISCRCAAQWSDNHRLYTVLLPTPPAPPGSVCTSPLLTLFPRCALRPCGYQSAPPNPFASRKGPLLTPPPAMVTAVIAASPSQAAGGRSHVLLMAAWGQQLLPASRDTKPSSSTHAASRFTSHLRMNCGVRDKSPLKGTSSCISARCPGKHPSPPLRGALLGTR